MLARKDWPQSPAIWSRCIDMARSGYGWEDVMVTAQVPRSFARWVVLGVVG